MPIVESLEDVMSRTLLHRIEAHMRAARQTPSRFGREAVNDPRLVRDMRRGRRVGSKVTARIDAYLAGSAGVGR